MKVLRATVLLFCVSLFIGCDKGNNDDDDFSTQPQLRGSWVNPVFEDPYWKYEKAKTLGADYGFTFDSKHKFIERKNSGWCGTPPIAYSNYEGHWSLNGSIINIKVGYWGGEENQQWKIISLNDKYLIIEKFAIQEEE